MNGRFGRQKPEEDYETILANLANDVQNRQVKLSEIRLRERRSSLLVTLYTLAAWVAYVSLWYLEVVPNIGPQRTRRDVKVSKALKALPVVIGPIVILFIRRIVQLWYERKGNAEEKSLQKLMKLRREKVEEIKKKTNYYTTRDLLQKYDESAPAEATPLRHRNPAPGQPVPGAPFSTPQQPQLRPVNPNIPQTPTKPLDPRLTALSPSFPIAPPRKQWYDKVADALLGDEDNSFASPSSRYALICEKCFTHNGLVKESMWEDAQFICPKCGHFNASARSKKQARISATTTTSASGAATNMPSTPAGISRMSPSASPSPPHGNSISSHGRRRGQEEAAHDGGPDLPTTDSMEVDDL
ncbi:hypothetical protein D9611_013575 [Ephemerocybe angulata]|uniref:Endoplasmic reticulum junction formation protein lunapark n=1 Tax=Ephemerocybe angulata TaxID=980116 RepID=A0A8H5BSM3_9AGAR|nr:hypothetical protein D9611_015060 [Tulosesus angulatus]KAF5334420.1 hypothetical protein D9611_013575 [Tulosesus angulatus]